MTGSTIWIFIGVLALVAILWRSVNRVRIWNMIAEPFHAPYPHRDVDWAREIAGNLTIDHRMRFIMVRSFADHRGLWLFKTRFLMPYKSFRLRWTDIASINFESSVTSPKFGEDFIGVAQLKLSDKTRFELSVPWRGVFNQYVPDHVRHVSLERVERGP